MAAIASSRTGYLNGTTSGWAARSLFYVGTNLYAVVLDTAAAKIRVYKGTGDGTWTEQDSAGAVAHTGVTASYDAALAIGGTAIHVAYRTATNTVRVRKFFTTTDLWDTADIAGANATTDASATVGLSLGIRSDGDVLLLFGNVAMTQYHVTVWTGTTWAAAFNFNTNTPKMVHMQVTGASDLGHMYYAPGTAFAQRSRTSADVNGTGANVETGISAMFSNFPGYVLDGATHRIAVLTRDTGGEADVEHSTSVAAPAWTVVAAVSPTTVTDPGIMGGVMVPYAAKWHAIWSGDARAEIHMDISDDYATPAFGTDTNVITGLGANDPTVYAIPTATGIPVLYTTHTATPTVDIVWAVGAPPASAKAPPPWRRLKDQRQQHYLVR